MATRKPAPKPKSRSKAKGPARGRSHSVAASAAESDRQARLGARREADRARRAAAAAAARAAAEAKAAKLAGRRDRDRARRAAAKAAAEAARKAAEAAKAARREKIGKRAPLNAPQQPKTKPRRGPPRPTEKAPGLSRLIDGCERILDVMRAPRPPFEALGVEWPAHIPDARMKVRKVAPGRGWTPWALVATYVTPATAYPTLHAVLIAIEEAEDVTRAIGSYTLSRIVVTYEGRESFKNRKRVEREWTIAEIHPWTITLENAIEVTDPGEIDDPEEIDRDSPIAARYSNRAKDGDDITWVRKVTIWLSSAAAEEVPF